MKFKVLLPLLVLAPGLSVTLHAQALLLDFGPTTPTGSSLTNSPFHAATSDSGDTTWNVISSTANTSGFNYSNGTAATGVTLQVGATTGTSSVAPTTVSLTSPSLSFGALGSQVSTGIYSSTSVATDGAYISGGASGTYASVGVQIGGLAAGTYTVYITSRNTSSNSTAYRESLSVGASSSSGTFDFSGYNSATVAYNGTNSTSTWTQATSDSLYGNYVALSITLSSGQYLNIASVGGIANGEQRGFLNSIEIVPASAIPEPATCAALAGLAVLGCVALRRRFGP